MRLIKLRVRDYLATYPLEEFKESWIFDLTPFVAYIFPPYHPRLMKIPLNPPFVKGEIQNHPLLKGRYRGIYEGKGEYFLRGASAPLFCLMRITSSMVHHLATHQFVCSQVIACQIFFFELLQGSYGFH